MARSEVRWSDILFVLTAIRYFASCNAEIHAKHLKQVTSLKDKVSAANLVNVFLGVSRIDCAEKCTRSEDCNSVFYDKLYRECRLHSIDLSVMACVLTTRQGFLYYRVTGRPIGKTCQSAGECSGNHHECRFDGRCGCIAGYNFKSDIMSCEASCALYGDTFEYFPKHGIYAHSLAYKDVTSLEECIFFCLDTHGDSCVSFDIDNGETECFLHSVDPLDVPSDYNNIDSYNFYQRNCA